VTTKFSPTHSEVSNASLNMSVDALPLSLKKLLCTFGGYFDGQLHRFCLTTNKSLILVAAEQRSFSPTLLIVARECYSEQAKQYPIENKAELKKLLALEYGAATNTYFHLWGRSESYSQVNIWQYTDDVPSAFIQLPESLLLALTASKNQIIQVERKNKKALFVGHSGGVIHSLSQTSIIDSAQRFSMSVGIGSLDQQKDVSNSQLAEELAIGIKKLPFAMGSSFIQAPKVESRLQLLKRVSIPFFLVFAGYLIISSSYLSYKKYSLQQQLASHSNEVSVALTQQQSFDEQFNRYNALKSFLSTQHASSPLWLVLAEIFPKAQFVNIRINNNRFVLRGSTEKATELLELLSQNERVLGAKFDFPTRRSYNRDVFVISFELVQPTSLMPLILTVEEGNDV
jgi:hypothetical protein